MSTAAQQGLRDQATQIPRRFLFHDKNQIATTLAIMF